MNVDLQQYYNSLVDKDADGIKYYFDIIAFNTATGMQNTVCSISQSPKLATGAERFKTLVDKAEKQKYNVLQVKEYGPDGQKVINSMKFTLSKSGKKKQRSNMPVVAQQYLPTDYTSLEGFENALGRFGLADGLKGVVEASAEKLNQQFVLRQQDAELTDLKTRLSLLEQEKEALRKETETYKERYKEILDEKKEMERDHKYEVQQLNQKLQLGSLAVNGALGFISSRPGVAQLLGALIPGPQSQPQQTTSGDDDDDDDITVQTTDPESRRYMAYINQYCGNLDAAALKKVCAIVEFMSLPGQLDHLTSYVRVKYEEMNRKQKQSE